MEYPFPPTPPGYSTVLVARWLLFAWALIGVGIVYYRVRRWKFIRSWELASWSAAAFISVFVSTFGICRYRAYDNNDWLMPVKTAAMSVSVAGAAIVLAKIYDEGPQQTKTSFIEMLVATAIVAVLIATIVEEPTISSSRGTGCRANLRVIGLSLHQYENANEVFPPSANLGEPVTWRVSILPFLDQKPLFEEYDQSNSWDRPPNDQLAFKLVDSLVCRANYGERHDRGRWFTAYSMPTGAKTIGEDPLGTPISRISDGTSNTLLVVEACGAQIIWTEPRDVNVDTQPTGINLKGTRPGTSAGWLSSYHRAGANVTFADGSVWFISANTDPSILKKLATIDGGEFLGKDPF